MKLEGWISSQQQKVEGVYFKYNISKEYLANGLWDGTIYAHLPPSQPASLAAMKAEAPLRKLAAITIWEAVGTLVSTDEERRRDEQMVMMEKLESFRAFPESCHYRVGFIILLDTF